MSEVADAETGERLRLTLSLWSKEDGRVELLRPRSLVLMGTGRLLRGTEEPTCGNQSSTLPSSPNAVVREFEELGPRNPRLNKRTYPLSRPADRRLPHASAGMTGLSSPDRSPSKALPPLETKAFQISTKSTTKVSKDLPPSGVHEDSTPHLGESTPNWDMLEVKYFEELMIRVADLMALSPEHRDQQVHLEAKSKRIA